MIIPSDKELDSMTEKEVEAISRKAAESNSNKGVQTSKTASIYELIYNERKVGKIVITDDNFDKIIHEHGVEIKLE